MIPENQALPRTLIVDLSLGFGGASSRVLALLGKLPHERSALAGLDQSEISQQARKLGLRVHGVGTSKTDPRIPARLVSLIRDYDYQVVDTQNVQSKLWASLAVWRTGTALVSTINSWYALEHGASLKGSLYQFIELNTNRNLAMYITVSSEGRDRLLESGISEQVIAMIPNAIEIDVESVPGDRASMLRSFGWPEHAFVCCAAGRLVWAKGYEVLIEAIAQLAQEHPHLYCVILGDGPQRGDLDAQIARAGLRERIRLGGFRSPGETLSTIKSCDVFVMPSRSEGTPLALLEAAALCRPILASRVGGIPDLVSDREQALLVAPGDVSALAAGLSWLVDKPQFAARLGMEAQRRVRAEYSLQSQVDATMQVYRNAWARGRNRLPGA